MRVRAYLLLLTGLGLRARAQHRAGEGSGTDRGKPARAVVVARAVLDWFRLSPVVAFAAVLAATINAPPN